jgi:hypothetical protein
MPASGVLHCAGEISRKVECVSTSVNSFPAESLIRTLSGQLGVDPGILLDNPDAVRIITAARQSGATVEAVVEALNEIF